MATDRRREQNVERALASARISGYQPSVKLQQLTEQYRNGTISAGELVRQIREHHQHRQGA